MEEDAQTKKEWSLADEGLQSGLRAHFLELLTSGRDLPDLIPSGIVWYDLDPLW